MSFSRASGVLLHPTSLPGRWGCGDLGEGAYRFADFLARAGQRLWQVLPLAPTGYGNSPYQALSAFAGNHLLISLERLANEGLLERSLIVDTSSFPSGRADFAGAARAKLPLLERSFQAFRAQSDRSQQDAFGAFRRDNGSWLDDYALFMALREARGLAAWGSWPDDLRRREPAALERWRTLLAEQLELHTYLQFQFARQWADLRRYCAERGIRLIGDLPFYVALDSADVWSHQEMFKLDTSGQPTAVAGVPPDYFSATGQLWGNPIYRWNERWTETHAWWTQRLRATLALVDCVRLDHFRGFIEYWEVPAGAGTAVKGRWLPGPGATFFEAVQRALGQVPIIAEDLGLITPAVHALRDRFGFPGMRVLQFAFGSDSTNPHLPHNHVRNCCVYTGTHDNDTLVGWLSSRKLDSTASEAWGHEWQLALRYLGLAQAGHWDFIRLALASVADITIIPLQDLLGLGSEARMNRPGTTSGNWEWRYGPEMLTSEIADRLRGLTELYGR